MQIEENVTRTARVGILLHVIHMEVGARGETPLKLYRFPLGGGIWSDILPTREGVENA